MENLYLLIMIFDQNWHFGKNGFLTRNYFWASNFRKFQNQRVTENSLNFGISKGSREKKWTNLFMQIFDFRMMNFLKFSCLFYSFFNYFFEHWNLFFEFQSLIFNFFLKKIVIWNENVKKRNFRKKFKPINKNKLFFQKPWNWSASRAYNKDIELFF